MRRYWLIFGVVFSVGCLDMLKSEESDEEEDEQDESAEEGDRQGDCLDGVDNDDDGDIDCEDQGCYDKPACEDVIDTGEDIGDTDTDVDVDTGADTDQAGSENPNAGECSDGIDNDNDGATDCDDSDCSSAEECDTSPSGPGLVIQLTWQEANDDLDLHLLAPNGTLESDTDCYYANCIINGVVSLDWGQQGVSADDPVMTLDDIEGTGPEEIQLAEPQTNGEFTIVIHDYPSSVLTSANIATITVYSGDSVLWTGTKTISDENTYTDVATINWATQTVTPL